MSRRYFLSYPKSGRTWVRAFLLYYAEFMEIEPIKINWRHGWAKSGETTWDHPRVLLVRNPYDVIVSHWFHHTVRKRSNISLHDMIRGTRHSIHDMSNCFRLWADYEGTQLVMHYADLFDNIWEEMLSFFNLPVDVAWIAEAHDACKIANIKKDYARLAELAGSDAWLYLPRERGQEIDPDTAPRDTHKFRRGKVGGYVDHLEQEDIDYITRYFDWEAAEAITPRSEEWRHEQGND
jgi:hypothetical protein